MIKKHLFKILSFVLLSANVFCSLVAAEEWSQFRGPLGNGHTAAVELPLNWSETENIVWKTPIHDRGWSSPVVWKDKIWMTTSTVDGRKLFAVCVDFHTGEVLHDVHVFDVEQPQRIATENTYATPTSVVEEGRVYVHYGTYGTACLDTASGENIWQRRDLKCDHENGAGPNSSPFLMGDYFIVNVDGRDVQYVIALDKTNGETVWKTERSVDYSQVPIHKRKAYSMPIVIPRGSKTQLVSPGAQAMYSYDPITGKELWQVQHRGFSIAPRPVYGNGMVFMVMDNDHPELWAVRPDGNGDITQSHVQWKKKKGVTARSAPLLVDGLIYMVNRAGILTCLEAETGKRVWKKRIEGQYSASPIYSEGKIYFFNESGSCTVINASRKYKVLTVNRLAEEQVMASPAVKDKSIIVRTEKHLYRVEKSGRNSE